MSKFTDSEDDILWSLRFCFSLLSFLGSVSLLLAYLLLKDLRNFAFRLVLMLSISDMIRDIAGFIPNQANESSARCTLQAMVISYGDLASLFWCASIAFTLHMAFLKSNKSFVPSRIHAHLTYYHLVCWLLPGIMSLCPSFTDSYGDSGAWCWVKGDTHIDTMWRFLQFYIPLWTSVAYSGWVYIKVRRRMQAVMKGVNDMLQSARLHSLVVDDNGQEAYGNEEANGAQPELQTPALRQPTLVDRMRWYPLVFMFCFAWGSANRLFQVISDGDTSFVLTALQTCGGSLLGFLNAFVYLRSPDIRQELKAVFWRKFGWSCCQPINNLDILNQNGDASWHALGEGNLDDTESSASSSRLAIASAAASSMSPDYSSNDLDRASYLYTPPSLTDAEKSILHDRETGP